MKYPILRWLICVLALLTATASLHADRQTDRRNERVPRGHKAHPPQRKSIKPFSFSAGPTGYTPQQLRHAYGFDQLNTLGAGQVIGIVVAYGSPTLQADLDTFCAAFNFPSTNLEVYYPQGQSGADGNWASETSLDVQWAHAIAPEAKIIVVVARTAMMTDLLAAIDYAVSVGAKQINMSWGAPEFPTVTTIDYHFNVPGVTFVAASGDSGAGVSSPACSPFVVSVGGTSLDLDAAANVTQETGWNGSGGGVSAYQPLPFYQVNWFGGTQRGVPDVAYDADPNTGVPVFETSAGWEQFGGTSISSPQWTALFALANSLRQQTISSSPGSLYSLAETNYAAWFRDIISGNNGIPAGPGYDLVTGLGSPRADQLVLALADGFSTQVAPPVFFPPGGTYASAQNVTVVSATPGASIRYTLDGSLPTAAAGTIYNGPISISGNVTLNAIAYKPGLADSPVTGGNYSFLPQAAAPAFSPGKGNYTSALWISITAATPGATILYTTDGSTPTAANGLVFTSPLYLSQSCTLQAIARANGFIDSPVASATYIFNLPPAAAPVFSPAGGTYSSVQSVSITSATPGATIIYTTDGSLPSDGNGATYTGPVYLNQPTTLQALARATGFSNSPVTSATYTVNLPAAATPVFSPAAGTYSNAQTITISSTTPGATLVYTTDGSTPVEINGTILSGTVYSGPVTINRSTMLKAIAFSGSFGDSTANRGLYNITNSPAIVLNVLHDFNAANNGGTTPLAALVLAKNGSFYGQTMLGGTNQVGTIFQMTPAGVLNTLVTFNGANGAYPALANLIEGTDGNLYGATAGGGLSNNGTVFRMTPTGDLTSLVSFNFDNGSNPEGTLLQASDGNFYGTTEGGGVGNFGTIFRMTPAGDLTTLLTFNDAIGYNPMAGLNEGLDGNFYGNTGAGTIGTIFRMTPTGNLTTLLAFNGDNGSYPGAPVLRGRDGNFYGTTEGGGPGSRGTLYMISPAGALTTWVSFNGTNGASPAGALIQTSDGTFYGTTVEGGSSESGTVFSMKPDGLFISLASFDGANGDQPFASVIQGNDRNFYGTTRWGGAYGSGVVYQLIIPPAVVAAPVISPGTGTYPCPQSVTITSATSGTTIRYTSDGSTPTKIYGTQYTGPLTISTTTTLQAIAYKTGLSDSAVTSATLTVKLSPTITSQPVSQTVIKGAKVTFSVAASGKTPFVYQWLFNGKPINGANGSTFVINSAQTANAGSYTLVVLNLYGIATSEIATLTVNVPPTITQQPATQTVKRGEKVTFSVAASGTAPFSYRWQFDGSPIVGATAPSYTINSAQPAAAGNYAVVVTNVAGSATSSVAKLTVK